MCICFANIASSSLVPHPINAKYDRDSLPPNNGFRASSELQSYDFIFYENNTLETIKNQ